MIPEVSFTSGSCESKNWGNNDLFKKQSRLLYSRGLAAFFGNQSLTLLVFEPQAYKHFSDPSVSEEFDSTRG